MEKDKEQEIKAVKDSIKHWENIRDGKEEELGNENCSLCIHSGIGCEGCPIPNKTKLADCEGTPYWKWRKHISLSHPLYKGKRRVICDRCKTLAQEEIDFLKSLLIEETVKLEEFFIENGFIKKKSQTYQIFDKIKTKYLEGYWTIIGNTSNRKTANNICLICTEECQWNNVSYDHKFMKISDGYNISKEELERFYHIQITDHKKYEGKRYEV